MENKVDFFAELLTFRFTNENELPNRKKKNASKAKPNMNSLAEIQYKESFNNWKTVINNMRKGLPSDTFQRIAGLQPSVLPNTTHVTQVQDFNDFTDYFILRRDIQNCEDLELGLLSLLHTQFQKEIQRRINLIIAS